MEQYEKCSRKKMGSSRKKSMDYRSLEKSGSIKEQCHVHACPLSRRIRAVSVPSNCSAPSPLSFLLSMSLFFCRAHCPFMANAHPILSSRKHTHILFVFLSQPLCACPPPPLFLFRLLFFCLAHTRFSTPLSFFSSFDHAVYKVASKRDEAELDQAQ